MNTISAPARAFWLYPLPRKIRKVVFLGENHAYGFRPCIRLSRKCSIGATQWLDSTVQPSKRPRRATLYCCFVLVLMCGCTLTTAHAQSAKKWDKRGEAAEARQDFDEAFEDYRQAHLKKPADVAYRTHYERMRFQAANAHVDRGRVLRQSGDSDGAMSEFTRALHIDNSNQAAAQELLRTEMKATSASKSAAQAMGGDGILRGFETQMKLQGSGVHDIGLLDAPVELQPGSNVPLTLHMEQDSKVIYQAIGKAAGLNVIFDADYISKRIPVDLTSVTLSDALRIVGKVSGTFSSPVTSNTIFVAQNSRAKHNDIDDLAVETFYLTNVSQQNDANEVLVALRNVLVDPDLKIYLVASQNAIILRATPDELALADKLIHDLDRTRPEVVVDIAVLEVSRTLERNLGITLPTSFGLTPQASNQNINNSNNNSSSSSNNSSNSNSLSSITLNTLGNLNATNFAVSLSGGQLNALLSDDGTRILQNPRVRATDGQPATLKIGQRVPVATGSFNSGVGASIGGIGGIQTQFTYQDVGVNIDMTPTVHNDDEVSMKLKVEISTEEAPQSVGGISQPVFGQRSVQQVIQLKDGEPSLLAGLVQQQDTNNVTGTPGLGELPFFKYFFSSHDKTQTSDEIVFLLIPHIVRESVVTDENTRIIDTGTSQQIELRHGSRDRSRAAEKSDLGGDDLKQTTATSQPTSAANAASAMIAQIATQSRPVSPDNIAATATSQEGSSSIDFEMVPQVLRQSVGSTFQVAVSASNAHDLFTVPLQLKFDPKILSLVDVDSGELLNRDGQAVAVVHREEGSGLVAISASRPPKTAGVNGQGTVFTITFKALAPGDSPLSLAKVGAQDSKQVSLPAFSIPGLVHVK